MTSEQSDGPGAVEFHFEPLHMTLASITLLIGLLILAVQPAAGAGGGLIAWRRTEAR